MFILVFAWFFGSLLFLLYSYGQASVMSIVSITHTVISSKQEIVRRRLVHGSSNDNKCHEKMER